MNWFSIIGQDCCHILWQYGVLYLCVRLIFSQRGAFYLTGFGILIVAVSDIAFYGVSDILSFIWRILCAFFGILAVVGWLDVFRSWNNRSLFPRKR